MRRHGLQGLLIGEIVAELRSRLLLALAYRRHEDTVGLQVRTKVRQQLGVLGELLHENLTGAFERRLHIRHAGVVALLGFEGRLQVFCCFHLRRQRMVGQQRRSQHIEARLTGNLRLGAALHFVGQIQIFETLLGLRRFDRGAQRRGHLSLLFDTREDGRATLFHFTQINQTLLQITQLRVIESARRFFAVPRDERHRRAFVQQGDRRDHLMHGGRQFLSDATFDCGGH